MSSAMSANVAMDAHGRTIRPLCAKRRRGDVRARPRPLKVEAADAAVDVENLADERQPLTDSGTHRRRIDFVERDAARRNLGVVVATIAGNVEWPVHKRVRQASAVFPRQMSERRVSSDLQVAA